MISEFWFPDAGRPDPSKLDGTWDVVVSSGRKVLLVSATRSTEYCILTGTDLEVRSALTDGLVRDGVLEAQSAGAVCRVQLTELERFVSKRTPVVILHPLLTYIDGGPDVVSIERRLQTLLGGWHDGLVGSLTMLEQCEVMEAQLENREGALATAVGELALLHVHPYFPQDAPVFLELIRSNGPEEDRLAKFEAWNKSVDFKKRMSSFIGTGIFGA